MDIKLLIIIVFSFLYGFFEIFMSMRLKNKRNIVRSGDRLSIWILFISISAGYWLSFIIGATNLRLWEGENKIVFHYGMV